MVVSIVANTSARYAQSSLAKQNEAVTKGTLRMSTGQRVLSAADDAAAMAIGSSLKIENSGLKSAIQNATSATSMLQIADGALGQISQLITRLQTLAVQSSSGQYDDATRVLLNGEFSGLKEEVDRLANSTMFNDVRILTGTPKYDITTSATTAADGIAGVRLDQNVITGNESFRYSYSATTQMLTVTRTDTSPATSQSVNLQPLLDGVVGVGVNLQGSQKQEIGFSLMGITLTLDKNFDRSVDIANTMTSTQPADITLTTPTFAVANTNMDISKLGVIATLPGSGFATSTGLLTVPVVASGDSSAGGTVTLGALAGISYKVGAGAIGASGAASADLVGAGTTVEVYADQTDGSKTLLGTVTLGAVSSAAANTGSLTLNVGGGMITATEDPDAVSPTHLTYKVGTGVRTGEDTIGVDVPAMTLKALGLEDVTILTQNGANDAIDRLKASLAVLNQGRATVGAQQTRLEAVAQNLGVISDNNEAARSSLIDVDVSKEISDITTNSTLMQASIAMLSRANQTPDLLLELLKN